VERKSCKDLHWRQDLAPGISDQALLDRPSTAPQPRVLLASAPEPGWEGLSCSNTTLFRCFQRCQEISSTKLSKCLAGILDRWERPRGTRRQRPPCPCSVLPRLAQQRGITWWCDHYLRPGLHKVHSLHRQQCTSPANSLGIAHALGQGARKRTARVCSNKQGRQGRAAEGADQGLVCSTLVERGGGFGKDWSIAWFRVVTMPLYL
jgi:hypothetical protein